MLADGKSTETWAFFAQPGAYARMRNSTMKLTKMKDVCMEDTIRLLEMVKLVMCDGV